MNRKQISSINNPKSPKFGHESKSQEEKKEDMMKRPSFGQRMRKSSHLVMDEVLMGPKHGNNFWCCHIRKRYYRDNDHIFCCLYSVDEETEFYPIAVTIYFIISLIVISIIFFVEYYYNTDSFHYNSFNTVSELKNHCYLSSNYIDKIKQNDIITPISNQFKSFYITIQYLLTLCIVLWESLLNFYRYYNTNFMAIRLYSPPCIHIFGAYLIYIAIFITIGILQIFVLYIISPIIILIHLLFNLYCIHGFISILMAQYKHYEQDERAMIDIVEDLKNTITKIRVCGIFCVIMTTIYLLLIQICYDSFIIMVFAPFWWSINSILWNMTFIKNSSFIKQHYQKIIHCQYKCCINKQKTEDLRDRNDSGMVERSHTVKYLDDDGDIDININKKEAVPNIQMMKYPSFMMDALPIELEVIQSRKGTESLIPASKTPSLAPITSKNTESQLNLQPMGGVSICENGMIDPIALSRELHKISSMANNTNTNHYSTPISGNNTNNYSTPISANNANINTPITSNIVTPISGNIVTPISNAISPMTMSSDFKYPSEFNMEYRKRHKSDSNNNNNIKRQKTSSNIFGVSSKILHVADISNDEDEKDIDTEIINVMRKQSDSSKIINVKTLHSLKKSKKKHIADNSSSSVGQLMVKEGFYSLEIVKSLQKLTLSQSKETGVEHLKNKTLPENNVSNLPKPITDHHSSHI